MRIILRTRLPRERVEALLRSLPGILSGRIPDTAGIARGCQLRVGTMALSIIKDAFVQKARGGTDEAGDKWKPLAQSTIENRLRKGGGMSRARAVKELKKAYASVARTGRGLKKLETAKKRAKKAFEAAGQVEILRDTGVLLNSLSPAVDGPGDVNTILKPDSNGVLVGTNVPYAIYHHEGTGRIPQRRLWPEPEKWPASWWRQLGQSAASGIVRAVELAITGGRL